MKEPKTIADAKRLTLEKIEKCMEMPTDERSDFWKRKTWPEYHDDRCYCAFCIVVELYKGDYKHCKCIASMACKEYCRLTNYWSGEDLRKLYAMVKEIEV